MMTKPLIAGAFALFATVALADDGADIASHKDSVAAALSDLGVGRLVAMECMGDMPDHVWLGTKLTKAQGDADSAAMYACLRKHNPDLTEAQFEQAVNVFR
ncbi:hypothetical protein [Chachezhania sediminis]|uniref:hypothetical protein n=1 Tax=Chachezhania sediminis TaxID=2599291 RepID=UPI00131DC5A5|nr:hypothetical protein [Chachezhania sediminis]